MRTDIADTEIVDFLLLSHINDKICLMGCICTSVLYTKCRTVRQFSVIGCTPADDMTAIEHCSQTVVPAVYKFLLRKGEVKADPLRRVVAPKKRKVLPVFLKESDMDRVLDDTDFGEGFKGCRDRLIIEMFYVTGVRLAELIGLNDEDVDFSLSQIKVTGKRNKQRLIPFGEELKVLMSEYVNMRNEVVSVCSNAFFVRENGERLSRSFVTNLVKRTLSKVVAIKKRSPHVLRHTFATTMLNHDAKLVAIKELLGHESLATTEVYTHTTFEELKKVYNQAHPRA